jgi:hypothetical protein
VAWLKTVRGITEDVIGSCHFTRDSYKLNFMEPRMTDTATFITGSELPERDLASFMAQSYFTYVCQVHDAVHLSTLTD